MEQNNNLSIVKYGNPVLRVKCADVKQIDEELLLLIDSMFELMAENKGVGLAAPQVGVCKRFFVYDTGEENCRGVVINPVIVKRRGEEVAVEGCLSIPGLMGEVARAAYVVVTGLDEKGRKIKLNADGFLARVFQHEIDHLDGKLFIDIADPSTLETVALDDESE